MATPRLSSDSTPVDPDLLTGWKDIAAHFGKSVRTVQRWERLYGLPVQRLPGSAEIVIASRAELARWTRGAQPDMVNGDATGVAPAENAVGPGEGGGSTDRRTGRLPRASLIAVVATVAGATLLLTFSWSRSVRPQPADLRIEPDAIVALDSRGDTLWSYRLPFLAPRIPDAPQERGRAAVMDLDGDGSREVLIVGGPASNRSGDLPLFCFDADGTVRWTHQASGRQTFGEQTYDGPFRPYMVFAESPGGAGRVWAVGVHPRGLPSVLHGLDAQGRVVSEYWSNGNITSVDSATVGGRRVVMVGGFDNEFGGISVALLDAADPNGSAPARDAAFACTTCPAGRPLAFVVIAKPPPLAPMGSGATVERISVDAAQHVWAVGDYRYGARVGNGAGITYELESNLRPVTATAAVGFRGACRELAKSGRIPDGSGALPSHGLAYWWDGKEMVEVGFPYSAR